jgi:methionine biosynthesis protein MetW
MRLDLKIIANIIKPQAKVLDVGCGDGTLLEYLRKYNNISSRGIEIDNRKVTLALRKGLSVVQGNADNDLKDYPSNSVDYAILSQTLQATQYPHLVLEELKRISKYIIISVPNFGYWENRLYLALKGQMPVTKAINYQWYDTPNIHFCTIKDFIQLCNNLNLLIEKQFFINDDNSIFHNIKGQFLGNIFAKYGIFLLNSNITVKAHQANNITAHNISIASSQNG